MTSFNSPIQNGFVHSLRYIGLLSLLILCSLLNTNRAWGDVYKWRDAQGNLHFSDTAPDTEHTRQPEIRSTPAQKAKPPVDSVRPAPSQATGRFTGTMLWQVIGPGGQVNHILGTIHSEDPRVMRLPDKVQNALDTSRRFVMEVVLDATALIQLSTAMMLSNDSDLKSLIGDDLFEQAAGEMTAYGIPEMALMRMKPWAVATMLSAPKPKTGQFMDMVLYQRALAQGKEVGGLETAQEQIAVFDALPLDDQVMLLEEALASRAMLPDLFEQLIAGYVAGDLAGIEALARNTMMRSNRSLGARMMLRLNDQRNLKMVQRLLAKLDAGGTFAAVGALHLPGDAGILHLLQKRGYAIQPVH